MGTKNEVLDLAKRISESDAIRYEERIVALQIRYSVFDRNFQELNKLVGIRKDQNKMNELWALNNRQKLNIVIIEILRLFQNYLSSAKSLVDQTRANIKTWYGESAFWKEYDREIKVRFVKNPTAGFIEDLRNYNLHYSLPVTHATFEIKTHDEKSKHFSNFSFVLPKSDLLQWKSWKKGKSFLSTSDEEIDVANLAIDYHKQITDFHSWLVNRIRENHKVDLEWLDEMRKRAREKMNKKDLKERGWE